MEWQYTEDFNKVEENQEATGNENQRSLERLVKNEGDEFKTELEQNLASADAQVFDAMEYHNKTEEGLMSTPGENNTWFVDTQGETTTEWIPTKPNPEPKEPTTQNNTTQWNTNTPTGETTTEWVPTKPTLTREQILAIQKRRAAEKNTNTPTTETSNTTDPAPEWIPTKPTPPINK